MCGRIIVFHRVNRVMGSRVWKVLSANPISCLHFALSFSMWVSKVPLLVSVTPRSLMCVTVVMGAPFGPLYEVLNDWWCLS